jgi:hypothetical protein
MPLLHINLDNDPTTTLMARLTSTSVHSLCTFCDHQPFSYLHVNNPISLIPYLTDSIPVTTCPSHGWYTFPPPPVQSYPPG